MNKEKNRANFQKWLKNHKKLHVLQQKSEVAQVVVLLSPKGWLRVIKEEFPHMNPKERLRVMFDTLPFLKEENQPALWKLYKKYSTLPSKNKKGEVK